jgi:hypothetical protein
MTIKNEVGDDMNAKIVVPPGFKSDGSIVYPVLIQVYGGPNLVCSFPLFNIPANGKPRVWIRPNDHDRKRWIYYCDC